MEGSVKNIVLCILLLAWLFATVVLTISLIGIFLFLLLGEEWLNLGREILDKIK